MDGSSGLATTQQGTEVARINPRVALEPRDRTEAWQMAKIAVACGYYAVKTPEEALIILMTGRELGLTTTQSLRGIYVVKGKPMVSADAMVACVMADPRCEYWQPVESTSERCVIRTKRRGMPEPVTGVFTMEDAKAAKLTGSDMYQKYARVMLRHRCASELVREVYPDIILGIYCEGEVEGVDPRGFVTVPVAVTSQPAPQGNAPQLPEGATDESPTADPLAQVATLADLHLWYAALRLGAEDTAAAEEAHGLAVDHMEARGYCLTAADLHSIFAGRLHPVARAIHDALSQQHTPAAVVAAYQEQAPAVDALEEAGRKACLSVGARYFGERHSPALSQQARGPAFRTALATPPDGGPGGTRTPAAPSNADASAAPLPSTAANDAASSASASAGPRVVLDADETEARYLRDDAVGAEAWAAHLAACAGVFAMAGAHDKRREAFRAAGVLATRRAQTLDAIEAREGRGPEAASQALDGYRTRRVVPIGQSVRARTAAEIRAAQTAARGAA